MAKRVAAEPSISMVSACLLSLVSSASLDKSLSGGLVCLHFISGLNERIEDRFLAKHESAGGLE